MDLGSVSTGYSVRPVARAIKTKHAGLNLTGPAGMGGALCIDPEAASVKQFRMILKIILK